MDEATGKAWDEETRLETASGAAALQHAMKAAELYLMVLHSPNAMSRADKARIKRKTNDLLALGELLKASASWGHDRELPAREASLLLESSDLSKRKFMPWIRDPPGRSFSGDEYRDSTDFSLSQEQRSHVDDWKRAADLFPGGQWHPLRDSSAEIDLVQDITADCSVVASLSSAMKLIRSKRSLLSGVMFPSNTTPENGKYIFKLHFNGCDRVVEIDDRLPASRTGRAIFVIDRQNPTSFWPALVEKAYLKVRGGYDFPGSNSCTDLWVLTGWIPEQVFLKRHVSHDEALDLDKRWESILEAFRAGNVIMTLGTGRFGHSEEEATGLVAEHDYGVLDITSEPERRILVKNPWCTSHTWTGTWTGISSPETVDQPAQLSRSRGSFWMSLGDITQHFESMYLNWDPGLFPYRQDHHFAWDLTPRPNMSSSVLDNPQYSVATKGIGDTNGLSVVWILLARHFVDGDERATSTLNRGFMSIFIFDNGGKKAARMAGSIHSGPFVDSPQTLLKLPIEAGRAYTVVPVWEGLMPLSCRFTLSFFSDRKLAIEAAKDAMNHDTLEHGSWTRRTAGGNSSSPMYGSNPQFSIKVLKPGPLSVLLCTDDGDIDIHVDLVWANGNRVESGPAVRSLVEHSREYVRKCAMIELPDVHMGIYTAVCSTFHSGQLANFALRVRSRFGHVVRPVPRDAPGRLRHNLAPFAFAEGETARRASFGVGRLAKLSATVFCSSSQASEAQTRHHHHDQHRTTTALRISIISGRGPDETTLAMSADGEFREPLGSLTTPDVDVEPSNHVRNGLWVKVERAGGYRSAETFQVQLLSDGPVIMDDWDVLQ